VTEVTWTTQNFEYNPVPPGGGVVGALPVANELVGKKMTATLDPADNVDGNKTTSNEMPGLFAGLAHYWNPGHTWVRGHLLNDHIGGPNSRPNLFPITNAANSDHSNQVEKYIKIWLRASRPVSYEVTATQDDGNVGPNGVRNAGGSFHCYAHTTDDGPTQRVNKTIQSTPSLVGGVAGPTSAVTRHNNNWFWWTNDNNPGNAGVGGGNRDRNRGAGANGGVGPIDFEADNGMNAQDMDDWETNQQAGWWNRYYML